MDYSALLNELLTDKNVTEISKESGASADEVSRVVNAAVPLFEEYGAQAEEKKLTRAAASGTNRSILGTLLGSGATSLISQNSGVSNKKTSSILSITGAHFFIRSSSCSSLLAALAAMLSFPPRMFEAVHFISFISSCISI